MYQLLFSKPLVQGLLSGRKTQTRRLVRAPVPPDADCVARWPDGNWQASIVAPNGRDVEDFVGDFFPCPFGAVGDQLWVRECWRPYRLGNECGYEYAADGALRPPANTPQNALEWAACYYSNSRRADCWRPSIHMPRWVARLFLEIESIHVERLHEISEADAQAEGLPPNWTDDLTGWDPADHGYLTPSGFRDVQRGDGRDCSEDLRASDGKPAYVFTAREAFALWWDQVSSPLTPRWAANPWVWVIAFKVVKL